LESLSWLVAPVVGLAAVVITALFVYSRALTDRREPEVVGADLDVIFITKDKRTFGVALSGLPAYQARMLLRFAEQNARYAGRRVWGPEPY
jgi:hypothetical protein